jgi:NAD+ kinase
MKVIIVTKKTAWTRMSEGDFGTITQTAQRKAKAAHNRHNKALQLVEKVLVSKCHIRPHIISSAEVRFNSDRADLVITVGGDGTLLSASHHVGPSVPVLAINSDPDTSVGHFCATDSERAVELISLAVSGNCLVRDVTRMEVYVAERANSRPHLVSRRVLNEALFSHRCPAAMTRFEFDGVSYRCSGIWVGTGAGSTGAMRSAGGEVFSPTSRWLQAIVRERYSDEPTDDCTMSHEDGTFRLKSETDEGVLYLDGPHMQVPIWYENRLVFGIGEPLRLVHGI